MGLLKHEIQGLALKTRFLPTSAVSAARFSDKDHASPPTWTFLEWQEDSTGANLGPLTREPPTNRVRGEGGEREPALRAALPYKEK